jgi:hypothetical protein
MSPSTIVVALLWILISGALMALMVKVHALSAPSLLALLLAIVTVEVYVPAVKVFKVTVNVVETFFPKPIGAGLEVTVKFTGFVNVMVNTFKVVGAPPCIFVIVKVLAVVLP